MHNIICLENEWLFNSQKKDNQFNLETKTPSKLFKQLPRLQLYSSFCFI